MLCGLPAGRPLNFEGKKDEHTRAATLWDRGAAWSVEEIDLDPPRAGEVLVRVEGSGLCHSDEHVLTGDPP